jgi:hypothetical protein
MCCGTKRHFALRYKRIVAKNQPKNIRIESLCGLFSSNDFSDEIHPAGKTPVFEPAQFVLKGRHEHQISGVFL